MEPKLVLLPFFFCQHVQHVPKASILNPNGTMMPGVELRGDHTLERRFNFSHAGCFVTTGVIPAFAITIRLTYAFGGKEEITRCTKCNPALLFCLQ